jgi:hypothetical protein
LRCLRENVRQKRPELWHNHNWLLHHDNAHMHMSRTTTEFVTNNNMVIIPHPLYSQDLAPCDFTLFPELKMKLRRLLRQCLTSKENHKQHSTALRKMTSMVLLKHGKTMGSLYMFPRGLFWRRWQPKLSKLSQNFFFDLVRELRS